MGEQEAKVKFSEIGSQSVVTGFRNVGSAAGGATTNINSAGNALKTIGTGMKSSMQSVGQMASAFATLSLSIVGTWRAYRDLTDAQLAVDRANLKVSKTTEAIRKTEQEIAKLKKEAARGGLENQRKTIDIMNAEKKAAEARKKYGKNSLEAADAELKIAEAKAKGTEGSKKLTDAENKLQLQKEQLGIATTNAGEAQERFNDIQQNFYLSILPTALSSFGLLTQAFSGFRGVLTGGGGIVGALGPLGIGLTAISLAVIAFQTNFLGLRDKLGAAIQWIKDRFGDWQKTIMDVFNLIKSGDWGGAFNLIKEAALKFWIDLKTSVPFFGFIEGVIANIRNGEWGKAFEMIKQAAVQFWTDMKKAVPFLADVEKFITDISQAKWDDVFNAIVNTATTIFNETFGKGIAFLFGDNWKLGLDAWLVLQEAEAKAKNRPLILQYAITINAAIKEVTGVDILKWFKDHPLTGSIPFFGGITMMVEDANFRDSVTKGAMQIVSALGIALSAVARLLDPYIADLLKPETWTAAIDKVSSDVMKIGQAVWDWIFKGMQGGVGKQDWTKLFIDIEKFMKENMPKTTEQLKAGAAVGPLAQTRKAGIELNPFVPDNWYTRFSHDIQSRLGIAKPEIKPLVNDDLLKAWTGQSLPAIMKSAKPEISPTVNHTALKTSLDTQLKKVFTRGGYVVPKIDVDANTKPADQAAKEQVKAINNMKATIKVGIVAAGSVKASAGLSGGVHLHSGGMNETLTRDTLIYAHRKENVQISSPSRTIQNGSTDGKVLNITINLDGAPIYSNIRYALNDLQGTIK